MANIPPDSAALAAAAARLRAVLTAFVVSLVLILVVERLGYAGLYRGGPVPPVKLAAKLGLQLLLAVPAALYLAALWQLRQVMAAVARGSAFGTVVARGLRDVGACLIVGAALSLTMPLLHHLLGMSYPRLIDFDLATLMIGGLGLGLLFLARLIDRAATLQSELDEIF